ncbi:MAG: GAF domain-containing sensor histidine kinase [bacterium]|nr:GAF domain-containing sensor histidine kinase [bacterium]
MNLISFLDIIGTVSLAYAMWTILQPEIRKHKAFPSLSLLVIIFALNVFPNALEWMGFEEVVEPFEEYIQILIPAAFFLFFSYMNYSENEQALSSKNRVLMAIHAVTQKLRISNEPEDLWKDLLSRVIDVMGFDGGFIDFPEDKKLVNVRVEWEGWPDFSKQIQLLDVEDTILSKVLMSGEPVVMDHVLNMPDSFCQALNISGIRSAALFPVYSEARILGVMGIVSRSQYSFTPEEVDLFTMLGHHFGVIIYSSLLIADTREKVEELQRSLGARRHFLTLISDDLRDPLLRIRTVIQRLYDDVDPDMDSDKARMLDEADVDSFKLERLIEDVKELSILDSGEREPVFLPVDIMKEIERVANELQLRAGNKGLELEVDHLENLSPVEADRDLIHSALRHLLTNAIKYTPSGGTIILSAEETADTLIVRVADTGIGIEEEDAEKIFDMFYRTSVARGAEKTGTGLGLSIVRRIIRLHGGEVSFEGRPEVGTIFTVYLPRLQMEEEP